MIKHQDADCTVIACPSCGDEIWLVHDEDIDRYNDNIGDIPSGEQNYDWVVCENPRCKYAASVRFDKQS